MTDTYSKGGVSATANGSRVGNSIGRETHILYICPVNGQESGSGKSVILMVSASFI
jgi:hypothetical protein